MFTTATQKPVGLNSQCLPASKYPVSALSEIDSEILPLLTVLVAIGKSAQMAQISLAVFVFV